MRQVFVATIYLSLFTVASAAQETSPHVPLARGCAGCPQSVSFIQLIATPQKFHKKAVRVKGYVSLDFEDYALYLARDDYDHLTGDNGVWLDFKPGVLKSPKEKTDLQGRYVLVEGIFNAKYFGHMEAFAGTLQNVSRIEAEPTRAEYEKMNPETKQ